MRRKNKKIMFLMGVIIISLLLPLYTVFAVSNTSSITKDQTVLKDWIAADQTVSSEGTIKGDMISFAQYITSSGKIEGDMLSASMDISLAGTVDGDARLAGANIKVSGDVGKNVNLFSNIARIDKSTAIGGNLIVYANDIEVAGNIKGYTRIVGSKIVLSGVFLGDVEINVDSKYGSSNVVLHILPETKINGKLTYKGINEALIEDGSQIQNFEWLKAVEKRGEGNDRGTLYQVQKYSKVLIAAVIYFFISMLIYRLFPGLFMYQGRIIRQKPFYVFGIGLAAIALILAAVITFVFLLAVTVLIAKPTVAFLFATVIGLIYVILFYFSTIPVSMCLGNLILENRYSVPVRFGTGLLMITFIMSMLNLMGGIESIGIIFSALRIIAASSISIIGIGAILYACGDSFIKLRNIGN